MAQAKAQAKNAKQGKGVLKGNETHWKLHFDYEYIGSHNIKEGEEVIVTIKAVRDELVFNPGENKEVKKLVMEFEEENDLKMILNVTNAKTIERLFKTPHIDKWVGKRIQIYAADVQAFGQQMKALRIRDYLPPQGDEYPDASDTLTQMKKCTNMDELKKFFTSLPVNLKTHPDVLDLKDSLKEKYANS